MQLPELHQLRDIVFYFKMLLAPQPETLPEPRAWRPSDAALRWSFSAENAENRSRNRLEQTGRTDSNCLVRRPRPCSR